MLFWILSGLMALAVAAVMGVAMLSRRDTDADQAPDVAVYKAQLAEVDRDVARGVIGASEADRLRTEISRRLLAADARSEASTVSGPSGIAAAALGAVVVAGGIGGYAWLGQPGYADMPLQDRLAASAAYLADRAPQAEAEAMMPPAAPVEADPAYVELVEKLRTAVAERQNDVTGLRLLARHEAALGNLKAAYAAQARANAAAGTEATAEDHVTLAALMIKAAGGYVSPEAEAVLRKGLGANPRNGIGRYYFGQLFAQAGRFDLGFRMWQEVLADSPPDAPYVTAIRDQIAEMAALAGIEYEPPAPPALRGPSAGDVAAANEMSDEDRQAMIRSMVEGLAERLASEGGSPAEWARLIGALGVLGEADRARAILVEARTVFADNAAALAEIEQAADRAGLTE